MGFPHTWLRSTKKKFHKSPRVDLVDQIPSGRRLSTVALAQEEGGRKESVEPPHNINSPSLSAEDQAAIRTQAYFRGHFARQAFRALRSLVKLQALARGAYVRKQARIVLRFMEVIVRLQVRIRARHHLGNVQ